MSVFFSGCMGNESDRGTNKSPRINLWFTRFVCPALWFILHEPRRKDTHFLSGMLSMAQAFAMTLTKSHIPEVFRSLWMHVKNCVCVVSFTFYWILIMFHTFVQNSTMYQGLELWSYPWGQKYMFLKHYAPGSPKELFLAQRSKSRSLTLLSFERASLV